MLGDLVERVPLFVAVGGRGWLECFQRHDGEVS
jgi:hypothetical protein